MPCPFLICPYCCTTQRLVTGRGFASLPLTVWFPSSSFFSWRPRPTRDSTNPLLRPPSRKLSFDLDGTVAASCERQRRGMQCSHAVPRIHHPSDGCGGYFYGFDVCKPAEIGEGRSSADVLLYVERRCRCLVYVSLCVVLSLRCPTRMLRSAVFGDGERIPRNMT